MVLATRIRQVSTPQELEAMLKDKRELFALVYSTWCPFCLAFLPVFKRYAQGRDDCLLIRDDAEIIADRYNIDVIPTLLSFKEGVITKRLDGDLGRGLTEQQLVDFLKANVTVQY